MTEEELADIALLIRSEYEQDTFSEEAFNGFRNILLTMAAMADERDHLRAENERLLRENLELRMIPVFEEHRS